MRGHGLSRGAGNVRTARSPRKNGYLRFTTPLQFDDGTHADGLVYIAARDNAAWLGHASEADIAEQVAASSGPSGPNSDYVLYLADALRELGVVDSHIFAVADRLRGTRQH